MSGLLDGIKKLGKKGEQAGSGDIGHGSGPLKLVHIVKMTDNGAGARQDVNLTPGIKVSDVKAKLNYSLDDKLIRAKDRQVLGDDTNLFSIATPGEKFVLTPDTLVGVLYDTHPFF